MTTAPPKDPEATRPYPELVQAQHQTVSEATVQPSDLELTVLIEPTIDTEHPRALQQTLSIPKQPEVILPHPEPVQAQ